MAVLVKNKFKPIAKAHLEPLVDLAAGRTADRPIKPRPEDIPALVKSNVETSFYVECTPEIMRACLALNKENYRPWMKGWSDQISSDMGAKTTRFKRAGDPIRFDVDGLMMDGQHRFYGGVDANFTFVFLFVVGLPKDACEVIDINRPRKIAHVVRHMGYENPYILSAAAGWLCKFKKGNSLPSGFNSHRNGAGTVEEVIDVIKRHPRLHESAIKCKQAGRQLVPGSLLAAVHYIGSVCLGKPQLADGFLEEFKLYPRKAKQSGAPFLWYRELEERQQRLMDNPRDFKARGTVEAWNLWMKGIEVVENNIKRPEKLSFEGLDYDVL